MARYGTHGRSNVCVCVCVCVCGVSARTDAATAKKMPIYQTTKVEGTVCSSPMIQWRELSHAVLQGYLPYAT
eukprot:COSAG05_NODE_74_length_21769_cov_194.316290_13_plen_72_part_00